MARPEDADQPIRMRGDALAKGTGSLAQYPSTLTKIGKLSP